MLITSNPGHNFLVPWYKVEYLTYKSIDEPYQGNEPVEDIMYSGAHTRLFKDLTKYIFPPI